jgi:hypothetical protein
MILLAYSTEISSFCNRSCQQSYLVHQSLQGNAAAAAIHNDTIQILSHRFVMNSYMESDNELGSESEKANAADGEKLNH